VKHPPAPVPIRWINWVQSAIKAAAEEGSGRRWIGPPLLACPSTNVGVAVPRGTQSRSCWAKEVMTTLPFTTIIILQLPVVWPITTADITQNKYCLISSIAVNKSPVQSVGCGGTGFPFAQAVHVGVSTLSPGIESGREAGSGCDGAQIWVVPPGVRLLDPSQPTVGMGSPS
jgi:hypothetical protein